MQLTSSPLAAHPAAGMIAAATASADEANQVAVAHPQLAADHVTVAGSVASTNHDTGSADLPATPTVQLKYIRPGRKVENPRTYFDPDKMMGLVASIRVQGVLQPILIRPVGAGYYEIVAGERRYRAALEAFGEDYEMPVTIKDLSDEEAEAAAVVENLQRQDVSATEEANAAARLLGRCKGDRDEVAIQLGISRSLLDRRLALLNCSAAVQTALNEQKIKLGHAELLAALAKDKQDLFVPIIIAEDKSVAELKAVIEKAASRLADAIFPLDACNGCPHNSELQRTMFDESITDGCCTNSACFKEKTEAVLAQTVESLRDEYPVIRILRVGDNATRVTLTAEGDKGVGAEQAEACRACASFGAAVSALPQAMGKTYTNQCFDPACNANKVAAHIKAQMPKTAEAPKAGSKAGAAAKAGASGQKGAAGAKESKAVTSVAVSDRIKSYREGVWRKAMKREIANDPAISARYLVALCLNGSSRHIDDSSLGKVFEKLAGKSKPTADLGKCVHEVAQLAPDALGTMTTMLAAAAMDKLDVHHLQGLAKAHKLDLSLHWKLDEPLLDLLTKSEIEVLAKEVGLEKAFGDKFKKLFSEKKPDLIKALLGHDSFDYSAKIPSIIAY